MSMEFIDIIIRTYIALGLLLALTKLLGRKSIAQLTLYDYVIGLTIGNIAAAFAIDRSITIIDGIISMVAAAIWVMLINQLSLNSITARKLIDSEPVMVVYNGRILEDNLRKKSFNVNDILELLREQEVFDPREVKVAIIENDGELSLLQKNTPEQASNDQTAVLAGDKSNLIGLELVIDGKIIEHSLQEGNVSREELQKALDERHIALEDVTVALMTPEGKFYVDTRKDDIDDGSNFFDKN